jgi:hypothetical protein
MIKDGRAAYDLMTGELAVGYPRTLAMVDDVTNHDDPPRRLAILYSDGMQVQYDPDYGHQLEGPAAVVPGPWQVSRQQLARVLDETGYAAAETAIDWAVSLDTGNLEVLFVDGSRFDWPIPEVADLLGWNKPKKKKPPLSSLTDEELHAEICLGTCDPEEARRLLELREKDARHFARHVATKIVYGRFTVDGDTIRKMNTNDEGQQAPEEEEMTTTKKTTTAVKDSMKAGAKLAAASTANKKLTALVKKWLGKSYPAFFKSGMGKQLEPVLVPMLVHLLAGHFETLPHREKVAAVAELAMTAAAKDGLEPLLASLTPMLEDIAAISTEA